MDLRIDFTGLDAFVRRYAGAEEIVGEELVVLVDRLATIGEAEDKRTAPVWRGHYRRSITKGRARRVGRGAESEFGSNVPYARPLRFGRRAGARMPPGGSLVAWMRSKGIPAEREFVVRRAIGRKGIPIKHPIPPTIAVVRRHARVEAQRTVRRIAARLAGR